MIKCVKGVKLGDSLLRDEEGSLVPIIPDTFYPKGMYAFWMLKRIGISWKIIRVVVI